MAGLWDRLVSGKDKAAFEAEKLRQITALQGQIRGMQKEIEQSFATLGAATYRLYSEGRVRDPELQQACASLAGLQGQIDKLTRDIEAIRLRQFEGAVQSSYECPNGHGSLPAQNRFCHICGAEAILVALTLPQTTFCTHCGNAIPAGSSFCSGCGTAVEAPQVPPAYSAQQASTFYTPPLPVSPPRQAESSDRTADLSSPGRGRVCPNCGATVEPPNQWCIYCGTALDATAVAPGQTGAVGGGPMVLHPPKSAPPPSILPTRPVGGGPTVLLPETDGALLSPPVASSATTLLPETLLAGASGNEVKAEEEQPGDPDDDLPLMPEEPAAGDEDAGGEVAGSANNAITLLPEADLAYVDEENEPEPVEPAGWTAPLPDGGTGSGHDYDSSATRLLPETELEALPGPASLERGATTLLPETELAGLEHRQTCAACGAVAEPDERWCTQCGAVLEAQAEGAKTTLISTAALASPSCPVCGAAAVPGNVFCTDCGHALNA